jgi:hypothetical protein
VFRLPSRTRTAAATLSCLALLGGTALAATVPPAQDVRQFACPPGQVRDAGFTDIAASQFQLEINCLAAYRITAGVSPTRYAPVQDVLRVQMAQFIARLATEHAGLRLDPRDAGFTDLGGLSQGARDAINGLANAGIVNGTSATTYGPSGQVKRDQMASFLTRLQQQVGEPFPAGENYFSDDDGNTHEASINRIAAAGIVNGTGPGAYSPGSPVTRQQMSAFLMRYIADRVQLGEIRSIYPPSSNVRMPLAGQTVLAGSASGKVAVRLDRPATFAVPTGADAGGLHVTGQGRFTGFALVADGTDPNRVMISGGKVANGLPAEHPLTDAAMLAITHTTALPLGASSWEIPAGDYHLYLIADGSPVTVTLTFGNQTGSTRLTPTEPVAADLARPGNRFTGQGVHGGGATGRLRGPGLLTQLAATLHKPTLAQNFTHCFYPGEQAAASATYGPGCPGSSGGSVVLTNVDNTDRALVLHIAAFGPGRAETVGQGYSLSDAGVTEHIEFNALWLTF